MKTNQFLLLWFALLTLAFVGVMVAFPVNEDLLRPLLELFPGIDQHDSAPSYVSAIGNAVVWEFSVVVVFVSLGTAAIFAVCALKRIPGSTSEYRFYLPGGVLAVAVVVAALGSFFAGRDGIAVQFVAVLGSDNWPGIDTLKEMARIVQVFGSFVSIPIFAAMVCTAYRPDAATAESELETLKERVTTLRILLYLASIGLVAGVVASAMMLSLHIGPSATGMTKEIAEAYVRNAVFAYGALYSLLLMFAYVPTAAVIGRWVRELTSVTKPDASQDEKKEWQQLHDLQSLISSQVWRAVAIFAPVITSVIGEPVSRAVMGFLQG